MRIFALCLLLTGFGYAQKQEVRIGILIDGDSPFAQDYIADMKPEILTLLQRDFEVSFPPDKMLDSQFDISLIKQNLDTLLADESVDMILCTGVLSTLEAAGRGAFDKPVFAPFGIDPTLPIYPRDKAGSGVTNFNYLTTPSSIKRDVTMLKKMKPLKKVHMVVLDLFAQLIPGIADFVTQIFADQGLEVVFVLSQDRADTVLEQLPDDTEMVYVTPQVRFSHDEKKKLFTGLAQRNIPSFSMMGREEVEIGALAGLSPKSDRLKWFRTMALNMQRTLLGDDPGTLPILITEGSKLVFNMDVARAIGWFPNWDLQIEAELLFEENRNIKRKLTLETAVELAIEKNLDLKDMAKNLELAKARIDAAKSTRKPSVDLGATVLRVDDDTSDASFGSQPAEETTADLTVTQLLYDEGAAAAISVQQHVYEAERYAYEKARLDLALQAAEGYLQYLQARVLYQVRKENVDLTNNHLETARIRRDIGIAGPSEVYRWESQLATDKLEAISARNTSEVALYALNQLLNETQELLTTTEVPDRFDPNMRTGAGRISNYVNNTHDFARFRFFMVEEGLRDSPELAQVDALMKATEREILADKRAYYIPTVSLRGGLNHQLSASSVTNPLANIPDLPPLDLGSPPDTSWNVALNFSLPLYSGGARKAALAIDTHSLEQLKLRRNSIATKVELGIRSSLQNLATTAVAINLREQAAVAARKNLDLVDDAYAKGVATLLDLLDAQNAALVVQLAEANALYEYFIALMRFQRASGNFDFFISDQQRDEFFQRLDAFYEKYQ